MQRRSLTASAICVSLLAFGFAPAGSAAAPAPAPAADCLSAPNRAPADGQHWYFRTDHATNQKCWYLRDRDVATTGSVEGTRAQPETQPSAPAPQAAAAQSSGAASGRAEKALFRDFLRWYKERGATQ